MSVQIHTYNGSTPRVGAAGAGDASVTVAAAGDGWGFRPTVAWVASGVLIGSGATLLFEGYRERSGLENLAGGAVGVAAVSGFLELTADCVADRAPEPGLLGLTLSLASLFAGTASFAAWRSWRR